jgi:hypothetical protein
MTKIESGQQKKEASFEASFFGFQFLCKKLEFVVEGYSPSILCLVA